MSEETAVAEPEVKDPVENLPDEGQGQGEMDFGSALDAAFANLESPEETEPEEVKEEVKEKKSEEVTEEKATDDAGEKEESGDELESFDPTDALDEEVGDDWTPKAAARFKQLKAELKTSTEELAALRQQAAEVDSKRKEESGEAELVDVKALQEKVASYEKDKMFADLESTEAYKEAITKPLDKLIDTTKEIAEKYSVSNDDLVEAITASDQQKQDEQLSELLVDASDRDRAKVYRIIEDLEPLMEKRAEMMENAKEALGEANLAAEKHEEALAAERARDRTNAAKNVVSRVKKKLPFLSGIEGLDMEAVQVKAAEVDPSVIHPVDYTYNSVSAQILPSVIREYVNMRKENEVLTDRLAEYEGAEPTMSGGSPKSNEIVDDKRTFEERVESAFLGATG
jgi:hypothetical protein